ncbi:unnamed protein product [Caenorhabditis sp. 36 PRJEB53466]|nr:unnamed protein product [Caenorhabditis sp. 36 PRJEB53466]
MQNLYDSIKNFKEAMKVSTVRLALKGLSGFFVGFCKNQFSTVPLSISRNLTGTDRKETRHATYFAEFGRVILKGYRQLFTSNFIHANDLVLRNGLVLRLTQAPIGNDERGYIGTIEKFYWMLRQDRTERVVMLCKLFEDETRKCAQYYPEESGDELTFQGLTVKCTSKSLDSTEEIVTRVLSVKFTDYPEFTVKHDQYLDWPDQSAPMCADGVLALLDSIQNEMNPVVVHCTVSQSANDQWGALATGGLVSIYAAAD